MDPTDKYLKFEKLSRQFKFILDNQVQLTMFINLKQTSNI